MSDPRYRCSFDGVADVYERARPPYADDAIAWVAQRLGIGPGRRVLDLGAGTGKLSRQLVPLGAEIVAVEPGDQMRATLERVLPEVRVLAGTAESIPLPDASVDAIAVGQALHWFEPRSAQAEMHRVLRSGGAFAALFNTWDSGDPLLAELRKLVDALRSDRGAGADWLDHHDRRLFGEPEERSFGQSLYLTVDAIADWVASTSPVAGADRETQARVDKDVRALVADPGADVMIGTNVLVADRV